MLLQILSTRYTPRGILANTNYDGDYSSKPLNSFHAYIYMTMHNADSSRRGKRQRSSVLGHCVCTYSIRECIYASKQLCNRVLPQSLVAASLPRSAPGSGQRNPLHRAMRLRGRAAYEAQRVSEQTEKIGLAGVGKIIYIVRQPSDPLEKAPFGTSNNFTCAHKRITHGLLLLLSN